MKPSRRLSWRRAPSAHSDLAAPVKHSTRSWWIIPEDGMITSDERLTLEGLIHWQLPIYTITYPQAAPIDVYLVENQDENYSKVP